jgi:hypothetical protein
MYGKKLKCKSIDISVFFNISASCGDVSPIIVDPADKIQVYGGHHSKKT